MRFKQRKNPLNAFVPIDITTEKALSEPKGTKLNRNWVIDKNEPYIDNRKKDK